MLDSDLDTLLIDELRYEGYDNWSSGTDHTTGVRELAFEKKGEGDA